MNIGEISIKYLMLVKQANSFRSIDDLLQNEKDPNILSQLFDKKKKLLVLVDSGQLTAQKYLTICKKTMAESTNEQIKDSVQMQIISAEDDVKSWFKDVIEQTKQRLEDQQKKISKLAKGSNQVAPKSSQEQKPNSKIVKQEKKQPSQLQARVSTKPAALIEPSKIYSFKVLDSLMQQNGGNKQYFMSLFEQKQKLLQLCKQKKINAQVYYQAIQKLQKLDNQDVSFAVKMQIDQLKQFHEGKIQQWFKDRLQDSEQEKEKQQQKYSMFKTGKVGPKNQKRQSEFTDVENITNEVKNKVKSTNINLSNKILFSFRYLDEEMDKNISDSKIFCQLFEQKLKFLQLLKKGEVDAQGYRDILAQIIQQSQNEELKSAAQMEVDLHDITGDVQEFFQSAIQQTGQKFEEQEKLYKKLTGKTGGIGEAGGKKNQESLVIEEEPKPDISDIVSFVVLTQYLQKYKKDYDYCFLLKQKGAKLLKLVEDKKLGPNEYIRFLEKKIESCKDKETLTLMKKELKKFQQVQNGAKLFHEILGQYVNKIKVNLGKRSSYDSKIEINEYTIDQAEPGIKIEYLLRKLGKYESLFVYYKKNKLERHLKQFESQYKNIKKNTINLCEKIKNGDANHTSIREYVDKGLHNVTFSILHRESRASYNQKLKEVVEKIKKSNVKIGEYMKGLKKGINKNNLQEGVKMIQKNNRTIEYLEKLKNQDFVPFPLVEEVKTQMYNLDLNKNLTQNQIQVIVTNIDGVRDALVFKIFMIDRKHPRFQANIVNGPQNKIQVIIKIPPEIMEDIIKGSEKKYLNFALFSKGWFSQSLVAEGDVELNFIRSNRMEDKLSLKEGRINIDYILNVKKPKKPLVTDILTIKVTQYPRYEHNPSIQNQFIKTMMPFEKPTQSQIKS